MIDAMLDDIEIRQLRLMLNTAIDELKALREEKKTLEDDYKILLRTISNKKTTDK
jgi:hypothetical protein